MVAVVAAVAMVAAVSAAGFVTVLGSAVTFEWGVAEAVAVGEVVPPERPIPSVSSSVWGCNWIHVCTSVWFS